MYFTKLIIIIFNQKEHYGEHLESVTYITLAQKVCRWIFNMSYVMTPADITADTICLCNMEANRIKLLDSAFIYIKICLQLQYLFFSFFQFIMHFVFIKN